jgi:hypothetical protein
MIPAPQPGAGIGRRRLVLGALALLTFGAGFLGQGRLQIGARTTPPAVSAIVTDVLGGTGDEQPAQIQIAITISNDGRQEVRVRGPSGPSGGVDVQRLDPGVLIVPARSQGQLNADASLDCARAAPLSVPPFQLELSNGDEQELRVGGSGALLEACAHAGNAVRPLAVSTQPQIVGGQLVVWLSSPTGRPARVTSIRAGGVPLSSLDLPARVAEQAPASVRLSAPESCPVPWRVTGVPTSLAVDLAPDSLTGSTSSLELAIGPQLATWLLEHACGASG